MSVIGLVSKQHSKSRLVSSKKIGHAASTNHFFSITTLKIRAYATTQGCTKLSPKWATGFLFWYKKTVMPKKKVFAARTLKDCLPNLPLETGQ
jgi:hypothetical protein